MNSSFFSLILVGAIVLLGGLGARAQEATPTVESPFASLGLPELTVTATNESISVDQAKVSSGRYLVNFVNNSDSPEASAGFVRLIDGKTLADLSWADESAAGTPVPEMGPPPEAIAWLYDTYITGAGSAFSPRTVVDLPAGDYGVWADDPASELSAAALTVTGDPNALIEGPMPAAVTIVEVGKGGAGFSFDVQGELTAGRQVVAVTNDSDQPHFIVGLQHPEPFKQDDLMAVMMFDPSTRATPTPGMLDPGQFTPAAWVGVQSSGTTQWVTMDLAAGDVALLCFVTDPAADEIPHAFQGMAQVLPVTEG
jgi:hypothetical protein